MFFLTLYFFRIVGRAICALPTTHSNLFHNFDHMSFLPMDENVEQIRVVDNAKITLFIS